MAQPASDQSPTLKSLIDELSAIHAKHGDIAVGVSGGHPQILMQADPRVAAVGNSKGLLRLVSRGGRPCVVLG